MIDHGGEILILTGPPGTGKTTTATTLAALDGSVKVHLHSDDFWHYKHGAIQPYRPEAHRQNEVVISVVAKVAAGYAEGGYFVIIDGSSGLGFLKRSEPSIDRSIISCFAPRWMLRSNAAALAAATRCPIQNPSGRCISNFPRSGLWSAMSSQPKTTIRKGCYHA